MARTCANCAFGISTQTAASLADVSLTPAFQLSCHAEPPVPASNGNANWPVVGAGDWCGAWRAIPTNGDRASS